MHHDVRYMWFQKYVYERDWGGREGLLNFGLEGGDTLYETSISPC